MRESLETTRQPVSNEKETLDLPFDEPDETISEELDIDPDNYKKDLSYYIHRFGAEFVHLKEKIAQSKLAGWTKDKLDTWESEENKRKKALYGAIGLVAISGVAYGAFKADALNKKTLIEMGGPAIPSADRFRARK